MKVCSYSFLFSFLFIWSSVFSIKAQNLIPNPSFSTGEDGRYLFWRNVEDLIAGQYVYKDKRDTAIIFEAEIQGKFPNSMNYFGNGTPYIFTPLKEPLKEGLYYQIGFDIKQADSSQLLLKGLCISFKNGSTAVVFLELSEVNKSDYWSRVEGVYLAKGGEEIVYLGNISRDLTEPF